MKTIYKIAIIGILLAVVVLTQGAMAITYCAYCGQLFTGTSCPCLVNLTTTV